MIIFNSRDIRYKDPFGAIQKDKNIKFKIENKSIDKPVKEAYLLVFRDGEKDKTSFIQGEQTESKKDKEDGINHANQGFEFNWIGHKSGLYFYGFKVYYIEGGEEYIGEYQLTVYENDGFDEPEWMKEGLMYQIFPDRFAKSESYCPPTQNKEYVMRTDWGGVPYGRPDQNGIVWNNDFFGGNIKGIIENLPYLQSLGVTVIYLNPIFEAFSNHRYDTANYMKIDPVLGDEESFRELCSEAKKLDIRIILDGVFNHTGSDSLYFNKENRYPEIGAYQSRDSKYADWYNFTNFPNDYESWWGINTLPQVNEKSESFLNYTLRDSNSVVKHWLECGASGFRLDVADELPDEFLDELRIAVKGINPHAVIIGEVWEDASNKISYGMRRRYLQGKQLDSVMNYPLKDAIIGFVLGYDSGFKFQEKIETLRENYPKHVFYSTMNILGTHDTTRILTVLLQGRTRGEISSARQRLFLALLIWAFMPGIPCLYYGDELGMQGEKDPLNRGCFLFKNREKEIYSFYKRLLAFRKTIPNMGNLEYEPASAREDYFAFVRKNDKTSVLVVINRGNHHSILKVDLLGEEKIKDFFSSGEVEFDGKCTYILHENSGIVVFVGK